MQADQDRFDRCLYVTELAEDKKVEIWTSAFTLAEVFKKKCGDEVAGVTQKNDKDFENYIEQEFITKVQVDVEVGTLARRLLRQFPKIKKPQDAIHIATCLLNNVDELHTFDSTDLLGLSDQIPRQDHKMLKICAPPPRPVNPQTELDLDATE